MRKYRLIAVALVALVLPQASHGQSAATRAAVCPQGTAPATIRHSVIKPGKWPAFEKAVAAHSAWYRAKGSGTTTRIVRVIETKRGKTALSTAAAAVTITRHAGEPPARDAGYAAFTAMYKDSASIADEARVCLPAG
jgi:hypothetical protein